jgi:6-phosphogluconolactonase (cycloisomerase 2 family)
MWISTAPAAGPGSNSIVAILSPNDQFLFVSNQGDGLITVFSVNTGALTAITGSPFAAGGGGTPAGMATDQSVKVSLMNFQKGDKVGTLDGMLLDGVTRIQGSAPVRIEH